MGIDILREWVYNRDIEEINTTVHKMSPCEIAVSQGFLLLFMKAAAVLLIAVKPFAYVVCYYTRHYGRYERK